jgi:hypothetical protein
MIPAPFQPYAKAAYPVLLTLIGVLGQWLATGAFDRAETATAVTGALTSLLALAVPNAPSPPGPNPVENDPDTVLAGLPDPGND